MFGKGISILFNREICGTMSERHDIAVKFYGFALLIYILIDIVIHVGLIYIIEHM